MLLTRFHHPLNMHGWAGDIVPTRGLFGTLGVHLYFCTEYVVTTNISISDGRCMIVYRLKGALAKLIFSTCYRGKTINDMKRLASKSMHYDVLTKQ